MGESGSEEGLAPMASRTGATFVLKEASS